MGLADRFKGGLGDYPGGQCTGHLIVYVVFVDDSGRKGDAFTPQPAVPAYLIPENGKVSAMLFGKTKVTYQFADVTDYIPGHYEIASMKFIYQNGSVANVGSGVAGEKIAVDVREGLVTSIEIDVR